MWHLALGPKHVQKELQEAVEKEDKDSTAELVGEQEEENASGASDPYMRSEKKYYLGPAAGNFPCAKYKTCRLILS